MKTIISLTFLLSFLSVAQANFICTGQTIYYKGEKLAVKSLKRDCERAVENARNGFICTGQTVFYRDQKLEVKNKKRDCERAVENSRDGYICTGQTIYFKDQKLEVKNKKRDCERAVENINTDDGSGAQCACEEVTSEYAICGGVKYLSDPSQVDSLKREVDKVFQGRESYINSSGDSTQNQ